MSWVPCDRAVVPCPELTNVEFHCGRAEDLVPTLVSRLASQQLVAILDPPRAGLRKWPPSGSVVGKTGAGMSGWHTRLCSLRPDAHPLRTSSDSKVILAVRRAENLRRLLYVSCNPRAAMGNFVE